MYVWEAAAVPHHVQTGEMVWALGAMHLKMWRCFQVFDDKENYIEDVTDANFFKCVELSCELPGAGQLQVEIFEPMRAREGVGSGGQEMGGRGWSVRFPCLWGVFLLLGHDGPSFVRDARLPSPCASGLTWALAAWLFRGVAGLYKRWL